MMKKLLIIILSLNVIFCLTGCGNSIVEMNEIQNGRLNACDDYTIKELIDNYMENSKWTVEKSDKGYNVYNVKGNIYYNEEKASALIQFAVENDDIIVKDFEVNKIAKSDSEYASLVSDMCTTTKEKYNVEKEKKEEDDNLLSGKHNVEIVVKDYGSIKLELDADVAPITVTNFIDLVEKKFYDGLTFHRIMKGFMIQGGDPEGTGFGGSSKRIKGEFAVNGVENNISHVRGTISMARSNSYDSASSQFFIVHENSLHLDGDYAGFGHVTEGIEVVDKIAEDSKPIDRNGTIETKNQPIIETIRVIK